MAQYGEVRVDYITYTTGTFPTEANATVTVSSLVNDPTFSGDVQVGGDVTITGNLNVLGDSVFDDITVSGNSTLNTLTVTGSSNLEDVEISGTLTVTGTTNLESLQVSGGLTVTGDTNLNTLTVTGAANLESLEVSGGLTVTGDTNLNTLTVTGSSNLENAEISGTLTVTGNTELNTLTVTGNTNLNTLTATGAVNLESLEVSGGLTVTGDTNLNTLTVTGSSNLESLQVSGGLTVTGNTNLNTLTVTGTTNLESLQVSDGLTVTGNTDLNTLTVTGNSQLENVEISGTLTVTGNTFISGDLTVGGVLDASGITLSGFTGLFASGTAAAPSISFEDDEDTGIYNAAANTVRISTSGLDRLTVNSSGNVGIATETPRTPLEIEGPSLQADFITLYGNRNSSNSQIGIAFKDRNVVPGGQDAARIYSERDGTTQAYDLKIATANLGTLSGQVTVKSDGDVGIGTTDPGAKLGVTNDTGSGFISLVDVAARSVSQNPLVRLIGRNAANTATTSVDFFKLYQGGFTIGNNDTAGSNYTSFTIGGTEAARIDSVRRLLIGTTSPINNLRDIQTTVDRTSKEQIVGTTSPNASLVIATYNTNDPGYYSPHIWLAKSASTTVGTNALVANNERLGNINFAGNDGATFINAANIQAAVDGTPGINDMPGRLVFSTTASGASSPTERMRLDSKGRIGFNNTAGNARMFLGGDTAYADGTSSIGYQNAAIVSSNITNTYQAFNTFNSISASTNLSSYIAYGANFNQIVTSGSVTDLYGFKAEENLGGATNNYGFHSNITSSTSSGINCWNFYAAGTAPNYFAGIIRKGALLAPNGTLNADNNFSWNVESNSSNAVRISNAAISCSNFTADAFSASYASNRLGSVDGRHFAFYWKGTPAGNIRMNGEANPDGIIFDAGGTGSTAAAFVVSSDRRLKTNIIDAPSAVDLVKSLQPRQYDLSVSKNVRGFIADELQQVVPEAVVGTPNAEEAIGTLYDFDGTVLETEVTEPSAEELTYTVEEVDETQPTIEGQEPRMVEVTRTRSWTATGTRPVYQGVDQTKLIPLLTKALQECLERIATFSGSGSELSGLFVSAGAGTTATNVYGVNISQNIGKNVTASGLRVCIAKSLMELILTTSTLVTLK